ncbi:MAG TPA: PilZ domain-containing protein [Mariprofundaceae bacterium]|nr:PilZ domain-containing protein [Mariprofundaceae bacterium]
MNDSELPKLARALKQQLPQASDQHLLRLAEMLAAPANPPDPQTIARLLTEGCDPNSLHAAILFGRETAIDRLPAHDELASAINTALSHYDRMVAILMHQLVEELESRLSTHEQEALISKAMVHWMRLGEIELYNYFMEMPIKAKVAVRDAHEQALAVELSSDLVRTIAAGEHGQHVMTILPDSSLVLELEVISKIGNKVQLRYGRTFSQVRERRRHVRVQPEPLLPITIDIRGSGSVSAKTMDYSENGMGLITSQPIQIRAGHTIHIDWMTYGKGLRSPATVHWIQRDKEHSRLGIELASDSDTHLELRQMVARAERHILARLQMKGIPDSLL